MKTGTQNEKAESRDDFSRDPDQLYAKKHLKVLIRAKACVTT